MPLYTYECKKCHTEQERIEKYEERDCIFKCKVEDCGGSLERKKCEGMKVGRPAYQMAAITGNGAKIPGHFGKSARKKGGHYQP